MLLDILVQVHQVLLNLEMLIYLNRLFKTSLDLLLSLLAFNELLNLYGSVSLWPLVLLAYLGITARHHHLLGRQHGPVIEVRIWGSLVEMLLGSILYTSRST